jgi:hypothetical protein
MKFTEEEMIAEAPWIKDQFRIGMKFTERLFILKETKRLNDNFYENEEQAKEKRRYDQNIRRKFARLMKSLFNVKIVEETTEENENDDLAFKCPSKKSSNSTTKITKETKSKESMQIEPIERGVSKRVVIPVEKYSDESNYTYKRPRDYIKGQTTCKDMVSDPDVAPFLNDLEVSTKVVIDLIKEMCIDKTKPINTMMLIEEEEGDYECYVVFKPKSEDKKEVKNRKRN